MVRRSAREVRYATIWLAACFGGERSLQRTPCFLVGGLTAWTVDGHSVLYLSFIKVEDRHKKGISQVKCVPT